MAESTYSLSFDGSNDYVSIPSFAALCGTTGNLLTLSWWYKSVGGATAFVLAKRNATVNPNSLYGLLITDAGGGLDNLLIYYRDNATSGASGASAGTASTGAWHHAALVMDGTSGHKRVKFYLDGTSKYDSGDLGGINSVAGETDALFLAAQNSAGTPANFFHGKIDDVAAFSSLLSSTDISNLAAGTVFPQDLSNLVGLWHAEDGGSGTNLSDSSGGGHDGTLQNGTAWSSDVPSQLAGGASYTLSASVGSFTLTGSAATLAKALTLASSAGSFALTGKAETFSAGRPLSASAGAFVLTGQSATLAKSLHLSASAGSFTLTGGSATFLSGKGIAGAPGAFALTGSTASLTKSLGTSESPGSFTLTGRPSSLSAGRPLTLGAGSFPLTGRSATLAYAPTSNPTLSGSPGAFSLSGSSASLSYQPQVVAVTGALFGPSPAVRKMRAREQRERDLRQARKRQHALASALSLFFSEEDEVEG